MNTEKREGEISFEEKRKSYFIKFIRSREADWQKYREFGLMPKTKAKTALHPEQGKERSYVPVTRHMVTEAAVANVLAEKLELSPEDQELLVKAIFLHDLIKKHRIEELDPEVKQGGYSVKQQMENNELRVGAKFLREKGVPEEVIEVIKVLDISDALTLNFDDFTNQRETVKKIAWYLDTITLDTNLVSAAERVKRFKTQVPQLDAYGKELPQINMPSFDYFVICADKMEKWLRAKLNLSETENIPEYLTNLLKEKILSQ